ncbi:MAG: hypothetical protein YHS30scaffold392_19 [Phage 64_12]|nr:MAG: hypothetical protein YHS30scaffold392_19 [Phage 64_12]
MSATMMITSAGFAALVNAQNTGSNGVQLSQVGLSSAPFTMAPTLTGLPSELKRLTTFGGSAIDEDTIHVSIRDDSEDAYDLFGFGYYLNDGTLFAVYSQETRILGKSAITVAYIAADIVLTAAVADQILFGDVAFLDPPASTERLGLVELATTAEALAGLDAIRVVTPVGLKAKADAVASAAATDATTKADAAKAAAIGAAATDASTKADAAKNAAIGAAATDASTKADAAKTAAIAAAATDATTKASAAQAAAIGAAATDATGKANAAQAAAIGAAATDATGKANAAQAAAISAAGADATGKASAAQAAAIGAAATDATAKANAAQAAAIAAARVPVGLSMFNNSVVVPAGWYEEDGSAKTIAGDPDLWAYAQASGQLAADAADKAAHPFKFGRGDGATTFELPDKRGLFYRVWDHGAGRDPGRGLGTYAPDQNKAHVHTLGPAPKVGIGGGYTGQNGVNGNVTQTDSEGGDQAQPRSGASMSIIKR